MTKRWFLFLVCSILGLVSLLCGVLMPVHLRSVEGVVLENAGRNTPSLISKGMDLVREKQVGAAQLFLAAAENHKLPDSIKLGAALRGTVDQQPTLQLWGRVEPQFDAVFKGDAHRTSGGTEPITEILVRLENREKALEFLGSTKRADIQELLRCRTLTNTVIFPSSLSASGQALDAAISVCGLLLQGGHLKPALANSIATMAAEANHGASPQRFEQVLLDIMSLGQRLNWGQLTVFAAQAGDIETLRLLAYQARQAGDRLPSLYSAVVLSGQPMEVVHYLMQFSQTGMRDLSNSLQFGSGGLVELLHCERQLARSGMNHLLAKFSPTRAFVQATVVMAWRNPSAALSVKFFFYLAAGFLLSFGLHFARPTVSVLEKPLQVRGFHVFREILFALGFLLVVLLLSEPFLAQESQRVEYPFRLRVPTVGHAVPVGTVSAHPSIMNQSLLTLLLFFVLQALIYTACLVKLAEIRRQNVVARVKLKLLENEEHLFDAGLYLGFAGTVTSLILASLGIVSLGLMAAYSSTSFGIIFVSVFKIFNLRPVRRKLLMEAEEASNTQPEPRTSGQSAATP